MRASDWIGKTLKGRYQIEDLIDQGGTSEVFKANDLKLGRVVAIKVIHSQLAGEPDFLHRFEEEAREVAQLQHPNIVPVIDFDHEDGLYYLVLEFVPGETLEDRLQRLNEASRNLPAEDAARFGQDLCAAAGYAHTRGMIHGDIKPAHIMLDIYGKALLMDFGIAKLVGGQTHTPTGAVIGTALYMAPEQIQGERPNPRTDIYSLGVTLFEMVSGRAPYRADSAMTVLMMHLNDPLPDLGEIQPETPHGLIAVIKRALQKKPADRFASMEDMGRALDRVREKLESGAPPGDESLVSQTRPPEQTEDLDATTIEKATIPEPVPGATVAPVEPAHTLVESGTPHPADIDRTLAEQASAPGGPADSPPGASVPPGGQPPLAASRPMPKPGPASRSGGSRWPLILGAIVLIGLICLVIGALAASQLLNRATAQTGATSAAETAAALAASPDADTPTPAAQPTVTTELIAVEPPTDTPTPSGPRTPTPTFAATATTELLAVEPPTETPTPSGPRTPTVPPGIPYVRINAITVEGDHFVVEYETFEYTEQLPGMHVHFFFNTVPPEEAGVPGSGPWIVYGGPRPFTEYRLNQRPAAATQMCALVANANHSVQPDSGNCVDLPDY